MDEPTLVTTIGTGGRGVCGRDAESERKTVKIGPNQTTAPGVRRTCERSKYCLQKGRKREVEIHWNQSMYVLGSSNVRKSQFYALISTLAQKPAVELGREHDPRARHLQRHAAFQLRVGREVDDPEPAAPSSRSSRKRPNEPGKF